MLKYRPRLPGAAQRRQSSVSQPPVEEVPNGKPAWEGELERGPGATGEVREYKTLATAAHRRWLRKNNQVEDVEASLQKDGQGGFTNSSSANIVLYVGLGMIAIGLIITFVGLGERGFQTDELKLIGPSLIGSGLLFCLLRIFSCTISAYRCCRCCRCCRGNEEESQLISPKPSRVHKSAGAVTRPSVHPNFISDGEESDAAVLETDNEGDTSHVPVLPPIRGGRSVGSGATAPNSAEVLLDPQGLDRPPSRGSVMGPLTPRRKESTSSQIEHEIDDLIK
ncbi:hypothetical protein FJT64_009141 [Amphibalanus amphitrite]|uniref:Uncharacterized protein n=1 Tax=Amphibalanus amphitrite TaxID=1232801 RepID=A0A6A4VH93_AMPAM|nr:hypothetical protein FJT64_009141 [Amphibalanus amphitrite]